MASAIGEDVRGDRGIQGGQHAVVEQRGAIGAGAAHQARPPAREADALEADGHVERCIGGLGFANDAAGLTA